MVIPPPPGQCVPMLNHSFHEEILPNVQPEPFLVQLEDMSSHSVTCFLGGESDTQWGTTSVVGRVGTPDKVY